MSTTWGRLFGNTATFALRLELMDDPDHGAGATPFESASWGAFEIHVNGRNLCTHYDGGALSGAVNWYLSPLASWFRAEWTPLLHEERLPVPAIDGLIDRGHRSIRCRAGGHERLVDSPSSLGGG